MTDEQLVNIVKILWNTLLKKNSPPQPPWPGLKLGIPLFLKESLSYYHNDVTFYHLLYKRHEYSISITINNKWGTTEIWGHTTDTTYIHREELMPSTREEWCTAFFQYLNII